MNITNNVTNPYCIQGQDYSSVGPTKEQLAADLEEKEKALKLLLIELIIANMSGNTAGVAAIEKLIGQLMKSGSSK
ncbi:MAG: hypothetical protein A3E80_05915 [Chlamydiae bacterium RIFCSPHIGHO2_12_FULL_49_9]|nr:MAG: hypothetical protein A3E80_05915 [Chlamydiae bacterium RIFCSPHIGHO2_12_FULL_49_9]